MLISFFRSSLRSVVSMTPLVLRPFAKLPSADIDLKKSGEKDDFKIYYEDVLRISKVSKSGRVKIRPEYFSTLIGKVKDEQQFKMLLDAYFNFLGNSNLFPNSLIDTLVKKGLELKQTTNLIPLIENHNFLFYYPSQEVLSLFLADLRKKNDFEVIKKFIAVFEKQRLLKPGIEVYEMLIEDTLKFGQYKLGFKILAQLKRRGLTLSLGGFHKLAECLINYFRHSKRKQLKEWHFEDIQNVLSSDALKTSQTDFLMAWLHLVRKEHGSFIFSLLTLEDFAKRKDAEIKTLDEEARKKKLIFEKRKLFAGYISYYERKALAQDDYRYMLKFDRFFSDFEVKYGAEMIAPELRPKLAEARKKLVAKAQEVQEKAPEVWAKEREKLAAEALEQNKRIKEKLWVRQMKLEEQKTIKTEEERRARLGRKRGKDATSMGIWVDLRRKRVYKRKVKNPITGEVKVVKRSNADGNDPEVTGVHYTRRK